MGDEVDHFHVDHLEGLGSGLQLLVRDGLRAPAERSAQQDRQEAVRLARVVPFAGRRVSCNKKCFA